MEQTSLSIQRKNADGQSDEDKNLMLDHLVISYVSPRPRSNTPNKLTAPAYANPVKHSISQTPTQSKAPFLVSTKVTRRYTSGVSCVSKNVILTCAIK